MIPVVFVHYGPVPDYLKLSIKQAFKRNDVILLTDQENVQVEAKVILIKDVDSEAKRFESVYHHLSKNPEEFELRCFTRWGIIKDMMEKEGVSTVFYCDSDVLLYTDVTSCFSSATEVSYSTPEVQPEFRWSASAHVSLFTYEKLNKLWNFIMESYANKAEVYKKLKAKYKHHLATQSPGGVCDMTLLYLFAQENEVMPMCKVVNGMTFDHNINSSENSIKEEYDMRQVAGPHGPVLIKDVKFIDGVPHCFNKSDNVDVRFNSLHFQGAAKSLMQQFAI